MAAQINGTRNEETRKNILFYFTSTTCINFKEKN